MYNNWWLSETKTKPRKRYQEKAADEWSSISKGF